MPHDRSLLVDIICGDTKYRTCAEMRKKECGKKAKLYEYNNDFNKNW